MRLLLCILPISRALADMNSAEKFAFILGFTEIGFELGLFFRTAKSLLFCNSLEHISLRSFWPFRRLGLFIRTSKSSFFL